MLLRKCLNCGNDFIPSKNDYRIKFCCDKCRIEYRNKHDYMKKYYKNNTHRWKERQSTQEYKSNKNNSRNEKYKNDPEFREKVKQKVREYNRKNPDKKLSQHLSEFGLTIDDYNNMMSKQNNTCAICHEKGDMTKKYRQLSVDHDHTTGKVRGLLCSNCNFLLGHARDNIDILNNAINYLKENQ